MPIEFISIHEDEGWEPLDLDGRRHRWAAGGLLADAPVDVARTFDGAVWRSTAFDPAFNMVGLRCAPDVTLPRRHNNLRELVIVFGGELTVTWDGDGDGDTRLVGPGGFFIADPGTPYELTAGPEGATYIETWPQPVDRLETYWYDRNWATR